MATTYKGMVTTFRTVGIASANINLFTIWNKTGSTKFIKVKRMVVQVEDTGALLTVAPVIIVARITALPTGGTVLTKVSFDTTLTADANIECMGATASDGGAASTITASAGTRGWSQFKMRAATAVGQILFPDEPLIPKLCETDPIILRAVEGLVVQMVQASVTTAHTLTSCAFEETDSVP